MSFRMSCFLHSSQTNSCLCHVARVILCEVRELTRYVLTIARVSYILDVRRAAMVRRMTCEPRRALPGPADRRPRASCPSSSRCARPRPPRARHGAVLLLVGLVIVVRVHVSLAPCAAPSSCGLVIVACTREAASIKPPVEPVQAAAIVTRAGLARFLIAVPGFLVADARNEARAYVRGAMTLRALSRRYGAYRQVGLDVRRAGLGLVARHARADTPARHANKLRTTRCASVVTSWSMEITH